MEIVPVDPNEPLYPAPDAGALPEPDTEAATPPQVSGAFDDLKYAAPASAIARASLAPDTPTRIKRYAESLHQSPSDFGVQDGNIVRKVDLGDMSNSLAGQSSYARVEPSAFGGKGALDTARRIGLYAASGAGPAFPMSGAALGGIAGAPTMAGMGTVGAIGAGLGETAREMLDKSLAGEEPIKNLDYGEIAGQTALGGAEPFVGAGVGKVASYVGSAIKAGAKGVDHLLGGNTWDSLAAPAVDVLKSMTYDNPLDLSGPAWNSLRDTLTPKELANIAQVRQEAARSGVDLDLGQLSGNRALQVRMRQMLRYPETMTGATDFRIGQQRGQVPAAFLNKINELLPEGQGLSQDDAIHMFRGAGDDIYQKAIDTRNKEATINFGTALDTLPGTKGGPPLRYWNDNLQEIMETNVGQRGIAYAKKILGAMPESQRPKLTVPTYDGTTGKLLPTEDTVPDWRSWDYIRQGIKAAIEGEGTRPDGRLNAFGRAANGTYKQLVGDLTDKNPNYGQSLALYGDASDAVGAIEKGGVGFLNNMKGLDRQGVVDRMFSTNSMTPEKLSAARDVFVKAGKEAEWNAGASAWMRGKLDTALGKSNVAHSLYDQLWEQPSDRAQAAAALGPQKVGQFEKFMKVMDAARSYLPEGSPTATDLPEAQSAAGKTARFVGKVFSPDTYMHIGEQLTEGFANTMDRNSRTKLLNYLTTHEGDRALERMALLKPSSVAARQLLGTMFANAGIAAASGGQASGRSIDDYSPEAIQELASPQ